MMPTYRIIDTGDSRSFDKDDPFRQAAVQGGSTDGVIVIGTDICAGLATLDQAAYQVILVELGTTCLGVYSAENFGLEGGKIIGFNRYRLGRAAPTNLIELVVQPHTDETAKAAAVSLFNAASLSTAVCRDVPGRIVDRLIRPYFNQALNALDEGLAEADALDKALRMGLGYKKGPIELLRDSGLVEHFAVASELYAAIGELAYLPARQARVAAECLVDKSD